ncbi:MAG: DNA mismatch repair protein MutS, partial [Butyricicoccus sp.]
MEDPKSAKGIVKRDIVRMVTPGTVIEASMLDETRNNFLCCLYTAKNASGICYADISTGEAFVTATSSTVELFAELGRILPHEVLLGGDAVQDELLHSFLKERLDCIHSVLPEESFDPQNAADQIRACFGELNWQDTGLDRSMLAVQALGGLLQYLNDTQKTSLGSLNSLQVYQQGQYMDLDLNARRNLELCETMRTKDKKGSLLWVMDKTHTAMGSRLIRQWIEKPLVNPLHIRKRQEAVRTLCDDVLTRSALADEVKGLFDLERLISRVVYGTANCRDLRSLQMTLEKLPTIRSRTAAFTTPLLSELHNRIDLLEDCRDLLDRAIVEEPPIVLREGGLIKPGYNAEVDELRELAHGGKGKIAAIEAREREATGIKTLKVGYNRVFGYYIEVTKVNQNLVPEHYIRKQTLANGERYITDELKQLESMVLGAQERLTTLEYELFTEVRDQIAAQVHRIQRTAHALANLDVLIALAELAEENHYVCPEVDFSGRIEIQDGRHPVVEKVLRDSLFIPNDTILDGDENRMAIITGPNMAGKSTYMRQVALITIMAQIGSFVPARSAHIGIVDRVFTRVGASDDLASGQSTFMVEMSEVADILKGATRNSLVILDEIGRGTSTYDGMAIARSVVEYIADKKKIGCR